MTAVATPFIVAPCDNASIDLWYSRVNAMDDDEDDNNDDEVSQAFSQHVVVQFENSMLFQDLCAPKPSKGLEEDMEFMMSSSIMTDLTDALDDMLSMDDDADIYNDLQVEPLPLEPEPPVLVFENEIGCHFIGLGSSQAADSSPSLHPNSMDR